MGIDESCGEADDGTWSDSYEACRVCNVTSLEHPCVQPLGLLATTHRPLSSSSGATSG